MRNNYAIWVGLLLAAYSTSTLAYIGPGLGAGALAVVFGIIGSIFVAFLAIFWYPIKRFVRKMKKTDPVEEDLTDNRMEANSDEVAEKSADKEPTE